MRGSTRVSAVLTRADRQVCFTRRADAVTTPAVTTGCHGTTDVDGLRGSAVIAAASVHVMTSLPSRPSCPHSASRMLDRLPTASGALSAHSPLGSSGLSRPSPGRSSSIQQGDGRRYRAVYGTHITPHTSLHLAQWVLWVQARDTSDAGLILLHTDCDVGQTAVTQSDVFEDRGLTSVEDHPAGWTRGGVTGGFGGAAAVTPGAPHLTVAGHPPTHESLRLVAAVHGCWEWLMVLATNLTPRLAEGSGRCRPGRPKLPVLDL